jgi:Ca-activated chloride channel family protein
VTPLTSDVNTLETQLQSLNPFIMPEFGNRAELAFAHAANMIEENGYSPPHLLWITDEIAQSKLQQIKAALPASISATLVAAGTSAGSPIPLPNNQGNLMQGDNVVMVKTDAKAIVDIGADLGFKTVALGNQPAANFFESIESETIRDTGVIDLGYWLLMPIIIGWLFYSKHTSSVAGIMVFFLFLSPEQSFAAEIFKNKEQRAYDYLEINPARTLELTNTPSLVSEALFRQNQFEQAASALETERSTTALYNRANALAHAGKLKEALNLYTEVLKREDHESARTNKELIESFLENQPSEQSQQQGEDSDNTDSAESSESNQSQQQEDSEQSDESEINDSEDASENEQESENESTQEEQAESTAEQETQLSQQEARENQETEAILNQLNAPSSSILQNKFNLQYQKNPTETDGTLW